MSWSKTSTQPIAASILKIVFDLVPSWKKEWDGKMTKIELDYRVECPEGKVVDALEKWIESYGWVPSDTSVAMWGRVEQALSDLEQWRIKRIDIAQETYDLKYKDMANDVIQKEDNENYAG
jgi:hypothetical protein